MTMGKEWIRMRSSDLERLSDLGLAVNGDNVEVEVVNEVIENGFRTVSFLAGRHALQVYLDTRYERGGAYQLSSESKEKLNSLT